MRLICHEQSLPGKPQNKINLKTLPSPLPPHGIHSHWNSANFYLYSDFIVSIIKENYSYKKWKNVKFKRRNKKKTIELFWSKFCETRNKTKISSCIDDELPARKNFLLEVFPPIVRNCALCVHSLSYWFCLFFFFILLHVHTNFCYRENFI